MVIEIPRVKISSFYLDNGGRLFVEAGRYTAAGGILQGRRQIHRGQQLVEQAGALLQLVHLDGGGRFNINLIIRSYLQISHVN